MSKVKIKAGTTSYSTEIFVADTSSTTGAGLSTLTSATSGLTAEYRRRGASSWTAITLVGSGGGKTLGTWTSGGFLTDGQGMYELDLPNAALASGATGVFVRLYGATNMLMTMLEFELDAVDYQSATNLGLSDITDIKAKTDNLPASPAAVGSAMTLSDGAITAAKIASSAITADKIATDAITVDKIASDAITSAKIASSAITAAKIATDAITVDKIASNAITAAKIASSAITADKIATDAITVDKIASDAITSAKIASSAITAAKIASSAITADKIATDAITAAKIATDAVAEIADGVWDEAISGHTTAGTTGKALSDASSGGGGGSSTEVLRGPINIYLDDAVDSPQKDVLYVGEEPNLVVRVLDREERPVAVGSTVTATVTRADTGASVEADIACTVRDADLGIVEVPLSVASTDAALAGKTLRLTLAWTTSNRTNIAGGIILEIKAL